jgi:ADP-ribose pyrophosphatase YjhB (NUDIX family)
MPPTNRKQFCQSCGGLVATGLDGHKSCGQCGLDIFENPIPVVVALVPVRDQDRIGLLVLRRGIEPGRGKLALPGGFLELEAWQSGLSREVEEETRLVLGPDVWSPFGFASTEPQPNRLLAFATCPAVSAADIPAFAPSEETEALGLVFHPDQLDALMAFPLHLAQIRTWFARHGAAGPAGFHPLR